MTTIVLNCGLVDAITEYEKTNRPTLSLAISSLAMLPCGNHQMGLRQEILYGLRQENMKQIPAYALVLALLFGFISGVMLMISLISAR